MTILRTAAVAASILVASSIASAQPISVEDFAKHSQVSEVAISPTGEYVALIAPTPDGTESVLQIMKLDGSSNQRLHLGKGQYITDIVWSDDTRVVVSKAYKDFDQERPISTGELMAVDVDANNLQLLFGYVPDLDQHRGKRKDRGFADVARVLDKEPGYILAGYTSWMQGESPDSVVYKVNTHTGDRREVERIKKRVTGWNFDQAGRLRIIVALDEKDMPVMFYRPTAESELVPMPKSLVGYQTYGARFSTDGSSADVLISDKGEPAQLYRVDMTKGTREKIAGSTEQDVVYFSYMSGQHGMPFAVSYLGGKPSLAYLDADSEWAKLHAGLMKHFPGQMVSFIDFTKDDKTVLFYVYSDRNPGAYYLYNTSTQKLRMVAESMPWFKADRLAPMKPIEFTTKDGAKLFGYYTASGTSPRPMVVIPHGGPYDVSDEWGFDPDVQFLASRGYGVLQVNYRGSGNRGELFIESGWKHWGDQIQDDVADGVRFAIASGFTDAGHVCVYGGSFGGYSALMGPIRNPGMYKCAIGYAGVYDLNLLGKTDWSSTTRAGRRDIARTIGTDKSALALTSPAQHADKLDIPVFLVHGKMDETARVDQFHAMESALKKAGKPPQTMLETAEGHGFYKPENVAKLYRRMEEFLAKNLGPGVAE